MHLNKQHNKWLTNDQNDKNIINYTNSTASPSKTAIPTTTSATVPSVESVVEIKNTATTFEDTFTETSNSCTSSTDSGVNVSDNEISPPSPSPKPFASSTSISSTATTANPFNPQYYINNKNTKDDKNNINNLNDVVVVVAAEEGDNDSGHDDDDVVVQTINSSKNIDKKYTSEESQYREQPLSFIKVESSSNENNNYTPNRSNNNQNAIKSENVINFSHPPDTLTAATTTKNDTTSSRVYNDFVDRPNLSRSTSLSLSMSSTTSFTHPPSKMHNYGSPAVSIRSIDSSVIDSDSDSDLNGDIEGEHENYVIKKLGTQVSYPPKHPDIPNINRGLTVLNQHVAPHGDHLPPNPLATLATIGDRMGAAQALGPVPANSALAQRPQIGSIALSNSSDVTFGDKHFYEGPVTIQQFLIDGRDKWKESHGNENPLFDNSENIDNPRYAKDINPPANAQPSKFNGFLTKRKMYIIAGALSVMTLFIVAVILGSEALNDSKSKLALGNNEESRKNIPINSTIAQDNVGGGNVLRIVPRDGWLAQPPVNPWVPLDLPVDRVIIFPTKTEQCDTQAVCTYRVRITQTFNIESQQQDDIVYNFLIGGDGNVYEGRGWDNRGSALKGYNDDSISFAYIGSFKKEKPNSKQLNVTKLLIEEGVRLDKLSSDYRLIGANTLDPTSTATSADALYESFESWPHWSDK